MSSRVYEAVSKALRGEMIGFEAILANARAERQVALDSIGHIEHAAILKCSTHERWMLILPDVDGHGRWRAQFFDLHGFSGHSVFNTKDQAIDRAVEMSHTVRDDEALDRIQDTTDFRVGIFATEQIALHYSGAMDLTECRRRISEYRQAHEHARS